MFAKSAFHHNTLSVLCISLVPLKQSGVYYRYMINIKIRTKDFELTPAIQEYVEKKVSSLQKFVAADNMLAEVEIGKTTNHQKTGDIFRAEVNISSSKEQFFAEEETSDLYASIDAVRDELERIIVSKKEKKQSLFRRGAVRLKEMLKNRRIS